MRSRRNHRADHLRAILWDVGQQRFLCAHKKLSLAALGKEIARAMSKGEPEIRLPFERRWPGGGARDMWSVGFSTEYLLSMLRFVAEHGWFWDSVDEGTFCTDHRFDAARITPGVHWEQVQELRAAAGRLNLQALKFDGEDGNRSMAAEFRANARRLASQADRLLRLDVPSRVW